MPTPDPKLIKALQPDIEFGTADTFYSHSDSSRGRVKSILNNRNTIEVDIGDAAFLISDNLFNDSNTLNRRLKFTAIKNCQSVDLVSRYVIVDKSDRKPVINNQIIDHQNRNHYHQFETSHAIIPVGLKEWVKFYGFTQGLPQGFKEVLYVRDEPSDSNYNRWILHHRIIYKDPPSQMHLRICHSLYDAAIPNWLNTLIPNWVKGLFYQIREKKWPNSPIMSVGVCTISKDTTIIFNDKLEHFSYDE